ncbi:hypothetical protein SAMN05443572_11087 [Myxococcus fulvus]|uniref:Lipoprotein n=1 Tax=Myxococcus fulvus TaxID=33 RepID=A0A511T806_MYXFU|nr:hypothetical protein [Myxococcus fulvus]GEN10311.1 hypothetical protein MFU01_53480 [Myxococcus fulvus]SEU34599.1 hypothetical protein SAMN05443572_11087 [Myxococcus fulvus]
MRLNLTHSSRLLAAVFALVLPSTPSLAEAPVCVESRGLRHCGLNGASVKKTEEGVRVESQDPSVKGGVVIHTEAATNWTAGMSIEGVGDEQTSQTVFSSTSKEGNTSTATLEQVNGTVGYSASFSRDGEQSTYSVFIYRDGALQASLGGIRSGEVLVHSVQNPEVPPIVRPLGMTYDACRQACFRLSCAYCEHLYNGAQRTLPGGAREWQFDVSHPALHLKDGRIVEGDEVVMREELHKSKRQLHSTGAEQIQIQTTAPAIDLRDENVTGACSIR